MWYCIFEQIFEQMKRRIIVLRHTESIEDIDKSVYLRVPDFEIPLTELGFKQAVELGQKISTLIIGDSVKFYMSPEFLRTRQTVQYLRSSFNELTKCSIEYDDRLDKQNWGVAVMGSRQEFEKERYRVGVLDYRFPEGESGNDVVNRFNEFRFYLYERFKDDDFPQTVIFVTHGSEMRLFLMAFCKWESCYVEKLACPRNGEIAVLELEGDVLCDVDYEARVYNPSDNPNHIEKGTS